MSQFMRVKLKSGRALEGRVVRDEVEAVVLLVTDPEFQSEVRIEKEKVFLMEELDPVSALREIKEAVLDRTADNDNQRILAVERILSRFQAVMGVPK